MPPNWAKKSSISCPRIGQRRGENSYPFPPKAKLCYVWVLRSPSCEGEALFFCYILLFLIAKLRRRSPSCEAGALAPSIEDLPNPYVYKGGCSAGSKLASRVIRVTPNVVGSYCLQRGLAFGQGLSIKGEGAASLHTHNNLFEIFKG